MNRHGRRSRPRRLGEALAPVRSGTAPATLLAAVQEQWGSVAGEAVAAQAEPVSERDGVVTIACSSAAWAQELDLLGPDLLERLRAALEARDPTPAGVPLERLRFTADAARHEP